MRSSLIAAVGIAGLEAVVIAVAVRGVLEGFVRVWLEKSWNYWFNEHGGVGAEERSLLNQLAHLPWGYRSLLTVAMQPLSRWHPRGRATMIFAVGALAAFGLVRCGVVPPRQLSPAAFAGFRLLQELLRVSQTVVQDGIASEVFRTNPKQAATLTAAFVGTTNAFRAVGLPTMGLALTFAPVRMSFLILAAFTALAVFLVAWFLNDEKRTAKHSEASNEGFELVGLSAATHKDEIEADVLRIEDVPQTINSKRLAMAAGMVACASTLLGLLPLVTTSASLAFFISSISCAACVAVSALTVGKRAALVNAYLVTARASSADVGSAQFCFYTDSRHSYPDGPHLDAFFYSTILSYVTNACALVGVVVYKRYLEKWSYRSVFRLTACLAGAVEVASLAVYLRIFKFFPALDKLLIVADEAVAEVVLHVHDIPWYLLLSSSCANGNDFVVLALCGAIRYLADAVAAYFGVVLLEAFQIDPDSSPRDALILPRFWKVKMARAFFAFVPAYFCVNYMIPRGSPVVDAEERSSSSRARENKDHSVGLAVDDDRVLSRDVEEEVRHRPAPINDLPEGDDAPLLVSSGGRSSPPLFREKVDDIR